MLGGLNRKKGLFLRLTSVCVKESNYLGNRVSHKELSFENYSVRNLKIIRPNLVQTKGWLIQKRPSRAADSPKNERSALSVSPHLHKSNTVGSFF